MFNFINKYKSIKSIGGTFKKFSQADKQIRTKVKQFLLLGISLSIMILALFSFTGGFSSSPNHTDISSTPDTELIRNHHDDEDGRGISIPNPIDMINPLNGLKESIMEGLSSMTQQAIEPFDDYVAFTPNIAEEDGRIFNSKGEAVNLRINKFYNLTRNIAWSLLPLIIAVYASNLLLENKIRGVELVRQLGKKIILFVIGMIAMRFCFAAAIDLINAINKYVLQNVVGLSQDTTLSKSLVSALGLTLADEKLSLSIKGILNFFAEIIIWFALFIFLITILFQFVVRFFHLILHLIMFPIAFVVGLLPNGGQFFRSYIEETWRILATQPIFLVGLGIVIEVIASIDKPVTKVILGLGSLAFLNLIPTLVNKLSGFLWSSAGRLSNAHFGKGTGATLAGLAVGGAAISGLGQKIMSGIPIKSKSVSAEGAGKAIAAVASSKSGSFKDSLKASGNKPANAFAKMDMVPLTANSLTPPENKKTLYTTVPNFSALDNVSLKDRDTLSAKFVKDNYDSSLGEYPLTEAPSNINDLSDFSYFKPSNPNTSHALENVIEKKPVSVKLGRTFDNTNQEHWNHISQWYAKNESVSSGKPISEYESFTNNPDNKMDIIRKASSEGYFTSQGIRTVKVTDNTGKNKSAVKYYRTAPDKTSLGKSINKNQINNARNSSAKTQ